MATDRRFFYIVLHILFFLICETYSVFEYEKSKPLSEDEKPFDLNSYHSYATIVQHLKNIDRDFSSVVQLDPIGKSFEGRPIYLLKISSDPEENKPIIFIDANLHAREWASNAVVLNLIQNILEKQSLLKNVDWYIVPMANPDGYEYTRSNDRMWRKNRSTRPRQPCVGVDLNRNFPFHWGESGVSFNPCSYQIYAGPAPLSEPETQALAKAMNEYKKNIKLYIAAHTSGQYIVYPYGYSAKVFPKQLKELQYLANKMADAIKNISGNVYTVSSSGQWYEGAGGSDDFALGALNIPYAYTIEFTNGYGFEYPAEKLGDVFDESMAAFRVAADEIGKKYYGIKDDEQ